MNIDRRAFLAFATLIAGASAPACTTADATDAESAQGVVAPSDEGGACFSDGEEAYPYQEGTDCWDVYVQGLEDDYKSWTSVQESGETLAESFQCEPSSPSHPSVESGLPLCPSYSAEFAFYKCHGYVDHFKKTAAAEAVACLRKIEDLTDSMAIYDCGFDALDKACSFHPTAESACNAIEYALADRGIPFSGAEFGECNRRLSGLRASGRNAIVEQAKSDDWFGIHSAIEGLGY